MTSEWKPRLVVVQAVIEMPDGRSVEANVQINPDIYTNAKGGVFRGVRVFCAHERKATYDQKVETTERIEKIQRGSVLSYAGKPLDLDLQPPTGPIFVADRLLIIAPHIARIGEP